MKTKTYLLLANWIVFALLVLAVGIVINAAVSAFHHPNAPLAPYYAVLGKIWLVVATFSFLLTVILSIFR